MKFKPKSFILYLAKSSCLLFLIVTLISCRGREVEIPIDFEGERLVLLAKLEAGKPARVEVSKTFPPTGLIPENRSVNNAQVSLYKNGVFYADLSILNEKGLYGADCLINAGQIYHILVEADGFPSAESEEITIPNSIPDFTYKRVKNVEPEMNFHIPHDLVSLEIKSSSEAKYLMCGFSSHFKTASYPSGYLSKDNTIYNEEDCRTWEYFNRPPYGQLLIINQSCISEDTPLNFLVSTGVNLATGYESANKVSLLITSVTKEWYAYNQVANKQPDGLDLLVLSPQMAYTNVKNGYGIVYGINGKEIEIK